MAKQHVRVELYRDEQWTVETDPDDATASAAYARDPITISHGRGPEQGEPTPSSLGLTFKSHGYNPENPASELYGRIGLNTPIRVSTGEQPALEDDFERSVSGDWSGGPFPWTNSPGGADWDVDGDEGTHTHPDTNVVRYSYTDTGDADHRVRVPFSLDQGDVTGAAATVFILGRMTNTSNYYALVVSWSTGEFVTARIHKRVGGVLTALGTGSFTVDNFALGTTELIGELYVEGSRIYAKCWNPVQQSEPLAWTATVEDTDLTSGTLAGIADRRETGNTNSNLVFRYPSFLAVPGTIRFCGEVASWRPRRSPGGDRWVEVEAGDPLRRLQAPQADPLRSALWRENLFGGPLAFWPLNEGGSAVTLASALPGGAPMFIWDSSTLEPKQINAWVEPILTPEAGGFVTFQGLVNQTGGTEWSGDFVFEFDRDAEEADLVCVWTGPGDGTAASPRLEWWLTLSVFDTDDFVTWELFVQRVAGPDAGDITFTPLDDGTIALKDGRLHHARVTTSVGMVTNWELLFDNTSAASGTADDELWPTVHDVFFDYGTVGGQMTAGMVVVWGTDAPPFNAANAAVVGRSGELAGARFIRLLGEEGIAAEVIGETAGADTEAVGPQLIDTLAANLAAIEAVDMGLLHGTRHQVGLTYRYRSSLYVQTPVTLDVEAGGEVAPPMEPEIGDLGVANDVTVRRPGGSSARSVAESGPLNVNPPSVDPEGVGRYAPPDAEVNVDLDDQLQGLADWRRHRGTIKAVRYPQVTVNYGALAADGKTALARSVNRLRIGDRFDLANAEPTGVMQLIPGYTEVIGPVVAERQITLNGTPANVYEVGVYDDAESRYDSAYSTTNAQITTGTSTSLSVAVAAGRTLWVIGSGSPQFPIDINLLGARVRVTAISGASSPQTFTISTTVVNGINKIIPSGTPVRLWAPRRYAL